MTGESNGIFPVIPFLGRLTTQMEPVMSNYPIIVSLPVSQSFSLRRFACGEIPIVSSSSPDQ